MNADFTLIEDETKPYITFAEDHGVGKEEAEKKWNEAEKKTEEEMGVSVDKFSGKEYAYTMSIFKSMIGIKESFELGRKTIVEGVVLKKGSQVEVMERELKESTKSLPEWVWYNDGPWHAGYNSLYGTGYDKMTYDLKKDPSKEFIDDKNMLFFLKTGSAEVWTEPVKMKKSSEAYDLVSYGTWQKLNLEESTKLKESDKRNTML